jgi:hypothetical protein
MSNTQHKARYVISVNLGRVFLSPTAMYTGNRPDGPWAPRPELFKMFVDSTLFREFHGEVAMTRYVGAIHQGTASTRFMIFDHAGGVDGMP